MPRNDKGQKRSRSPTNNNLDESNNSNNNNNNNNGADTKKQPTTEPITCEGDMPKKKFYRSRAHCNPLSFNEAFDYPTRPDLFDWTEDHYPQHPALKNNNNGTNNHNNDDDDDDTFHQSSANIRPTVLDIGCGFGGLTMALSPLLPTENILGLEIRSKVTEYVRLRIVASRKESASSSSTSNNNNDDYQNCSVMRTNAMKYLPNYFPRASLRKIFFCFPDPHFKRKNHPRRIVSERLLTEYAHLLEPEAGRLYAITDVKDLHEWHVEKCRAHPMFEELGEEEMERDPCVAVMRRETEEGKKVMRSGGDMYWAVYRRVGESKLVVSAENFFGEGEFGVEVTKEVCA